MRLQKRSSQILRALVWYPCCALFGQCKLSQEPSCPGRDRLGRRERVPKFDNAQHSFFLIFRAQKKSTVCSVYPDGLSRSTHSTVPFRVEVLSIISRSLVVSCHSATRHLQQGLLIRANCFLRVLLLGHHRPALFLKSARVQLLSCREDLRHVLLSARRWVFFFRHALFPAVQRKSQLLRGAHRELEEMVEKPRSHLVDGHTSNLCPKRAVRRRNVHPLAHFRCSPGCDLPQCLACLEILLALRINKQVRRKSQARHTLPLISSDAGDADEPSCTSRTWQFDHFLLASVDQLLRCGYQPCSEQCCLRATVRPGLRRSRAGFL